MDDSIREYLKFYNSIEGEYKLQYDFLAYLKGRSSKVSNAQLYLENYMKRRKRK